MKHRSFRAAKAGENPCATERFLDNFGTLLSACYNQNTDHGQRAFHKWRMSIGPRNVDNILEQFRAACIEFFKHEHECFKICNFETHDFRRFI